MSVQNQYEYIGQSKSVEKFPTGFTLLSVRYIVLHCSFIMLHYI